MAQPDSQCTGIVTTIADKCRRCYNCVRSCPAKAIRVQSGQAHVIVDRCIGCGNCIKVCAQNAKHVEPAEDLVDGCLSGDAPCVAILAPSYPAAYDGISAGQVVGALRKMGFHSVLEVGFGADLVAAEYARLLKHPPDHPIISSPCPALVSYIEKYMPELIPYLAPIVSPMVALGKAVKEKYVPGAQVVFIGPCTAKKAELRDPLVANAVDAAMTFLELEQMLQARGIDLETVEPSEADEPLPHFGALFPVSGGLLKAAAIRADLMDDSIVVVEGPDRCIAALEDLREGKFSARFLDALLCEGCIAGPGYSDDMGLLARKERVTSHVRSLEPSPRALKRAMRQVSDVDLSREFLAQNVSQGMPNETEITDILAQTNKYGPGDELNCGACGYPTCREKAIAVYQGFAEVEMCLPYLIDQLEVNLQKLTQSKGEIEKVREVASRAQQLASMGELAQSIAKEISKPLSNIVVFAQLVRDHMPENDDAREDLATVIAEGLHCREVLSGLRGFARQVEPQWEELRLADLVAGAIDRVAEVLPDRPREVDTDIPEDLPDVVVDREQMTQVLVNLLTNSIEAADGVARITIGARIADDRQSIEMKVADRGQGVSPELLPRLFEPFVTTKTGRGDGLGLAIAHGIITAHGGEIRIESEPGSGATVSLNVPLDVAPPPATREAVKVLLVDDDPDFLDQHRIILESTGFDVITAERSDEAIEISDREIPDAFVLDMMMERTDSGARLARGLRRDPRFRNAPIIMLTSVVKETGFEFSRNPDEVLEWMKADAWFDKPAPIRELGATIRQLLAEREGGEETPATTDANATTDSAQ